MQSTARIPPLNSRSSCSTSMPRRCTSDTTDLTSWGVRRQTTAEPVTFGGDGVSPVHLRGSRMLKQPGLGVFLRARAWLVIALALACAPAAHAATVTETGSLSAPAVAIVAGPDGNVWHTERGKAPRVGRT